MAAISKQMIVEALVFASDEPISAGRVAASGEMTENEVQQAVKALNLAYEQQGRAFRIIEVAGGFQFRTRPELSDYLLTLGAQLGANRLSLPALETLAIIAYRQPISRPEIEKIRGVNVTGLLKTLLEKRLITVTGRAQTLGRPLLYGTTQRFLRHFALSGLDSLPRESELAVILTDDQRFGFDREEPGENDDDSQAADQQQVLM